MEAGKLRHRISVQEVTQTANTHGDPVETWAPFAMVWAAVVPTNAREYIAAQQRQEELVAMFTIRYLEDLTPQMRIKHGGRTYNILSVINVEDRNRQMQVLCSEVT